MDYGNIHLHLNLWLCPPGYQAQVVKASRCGNERQERGLTVGKRVEGKWGKNSLAMSANTGQFLEGLVF